MRRPGIVAEGLKKLLVDALQGALKTPRAFGADLLNDIGGREMGQQKGGDQHGADDGLRAVQDEITGGADEGQQGGDNTLDRELQQLDRADARRMGVGRNELAAVGIRESAPHDRDSQLSHIEAGRLRQ